MSDKLILEYLLRYPVDSNARILPIDMAVEIVESLGGSKGRLITFAIQAEKAGLTNVRFLADLDLDESFGIQAPSNTFMTDFPDMEGYVISERNLDKVLRVALSRSQPNARDLHSALMKMASSIALLRFISRRDDLGLRITKTNKSRCMLINSKIPELDFPRLIKNVCQNTPGLPCDEQSVHDAATNSREVFESAHPIRPIRGKDYMELLSLFFRKLQVGVKDCDHALLATLHDTETLSQPRMKEVAMYLNGKS